MYILLILEQNPKTLNNTYGKCHFTTKVVG